MTMDYLGRPVFDFIPNHVTPRLTVFDDATRERLGFGIPTPFSTGNTSVRQYRIDLRTSTRAELRAVEDFFDARRGSFSGFWFPTWNADFALAQDYNAGATSAMVKDSGFAANWDQFTGWRHLAILSPETGIVALREIAAVSSNPPMEGLQWATPLPVASLPETILSHLVYVRFAQDSLAVNFITPDIAEIQVTLTELPEEYSAAESGERPIWLYEISQDGGSTWRWTSYAEPVTAGGATWEPKDITHGEISSGVDMVDEGMSLQVGIGERSNPFRQNLSGYLVNPLRVRLYRTTAPGFALDLTSPIYAAPVASTKFGARGVIGVNLSSVRGIAERSVPRVLLQPICNWDLFGPNTCRLSSGTYRRIGTLSAVGDRWVESAAFADADPNYFALGRIRIGSQTRMITSQDGNRLNLNAPFTEPYPAAGDNVEVWPGCDRALDTCINKFGNHVNFGGFPYIPPRNPQLEGASPSSSGGKK